jgi:hypothetical protein
MKIQRIISLMAFSVLLSGAVFAVEPTAAEIKAAKIAAIEATNAKIVKDGFDRSKLIKLLNDTSTIQQIMPHDEEDKDVDIEAAKTTARTALTNKIKALKATTDKGAWKNWWETRFAEAQIWKGLSPEAKTQLQGNAALDTPLEGVYLAMSHHSKSRKAIAAAKVADIGELGTSVRAALKELTKKRGTVTTVLGTATKKINELKGAVQAKTADAAKVPGLEANAVTYNTLLDEVQTELLAAGAIDTSALQAAIGGPVVAPDGDGQPVAAPQQQPAITADAIRDGTATADAIVTAIAAITAAEGMHGALKDRFAIAAGGDNALSEDNVKAIFGAIVALDDGDNKTALINAIGTIDAPRKNVLRGWIPVNDDTHNYEALRGALTPPAAGD